MPWLDLMVVTLIGAWACAFLWKRWRGRPGADGACGRCSNSDCGSP